MAVMSFAWHIVRVQDWDDRDEGGKAIFTPWGQFLFVGFLATAVVLYLVRTNLGRNSLSSEDWPVLVGASFAVSLVVDIVALLIASVIRGPQTKRSNRRW